MKHRFGELEGLRGVAAIIVVLYHFLLAFYWFAFAGPTLASKQNIGIEDNLYGSPLMVLLSGNFAVAIFFVLSGFVLSIGYFQTGKLSVIKSLATKRYLRLMLPALASILLAFIALSFSMHLIPETAVITNSDWLARAWTFSPNLFEAIKDGVLDIFVSSGNSYNNVLWTMAYEFAGSFLVFGFLAFFGGARHRWLIYVALIILTFNTWFLGFVLGMLIADLYHSRWLQKYIRGKLLLICVGLCSLFLGGYPMGAVDETIYQYITPNYLDWNWQFIYLTAGATGVMLLVLLSKPVKAFFELEYISKLGKYTFSLYLVHLLVLYTIGTTLFLWLQSFHMGYSLSALLTIIGSIPFIVGITYLFEKYVDMPSIALSTAFSRYVHSTKVRQLTTSRGTHILSVASNYVVRLFSVPPKS